MKKQIYYWILGIIFIVGIVLRAIVFGYQSEFEDDECRLLLAISDKSFWRLFGPIGLAQSAPPFFLILVKYLGSLCKQSEYFMHVIPFIFSLGSIFLFYKLSEKFFIHKYSIILANVLFCINHFIICFSSVLKQYSSDVFIAILLTYILGDLKIDKLSSKQFLILSLCLIILPFISLPSLFFIGSFIVLNIISDYKNKNFIKRLIILIIPFVTILSFYCIFNLLPSKIDLDNTFPAYWNDGFITIQNLKYLRIFVLNLKINFYPNNFTLFEMILWWLGVYYCIKDKFVISKYILWVCVFVALASMLHLYPFYGRVALYFVPLLILFCVKPLDSININNKKIAFLFIILYMVGFFGYNLNYLKNNIINLKHKICYPKTIMQELIKHYNPQTDVVIYNEASLTNYLYYSKKMNFYPKREIPLALDKTHEKTMEHIYSLDSKYNYWFYCSKDYSSAKIVDALIEYANSKFILYRFQRGDSKIVLFKK